MFGLSPMLRLINFDERKLMHTPLTKLTTAVSAEARSCRQMLVLEWTFVCFNQGRP